jgi:hypothetical protein
MDEKNHDPLKSLEDLLKRIENALERNPKKKGNMDDKKDNGMVWFSMNPTDMEYASALPTEFIGGDSPENNYRGESKVPQISPDLADFLVNAGMLFYDALYMPFRSGKGRLTDLFVWIERARDRMEQEDFNETDRRAYTEWCRAIAETLIKAQAKGLWLTDDEEDLVATMKTGIFSGDTLDTDEGGAL